MHTKHLNYMLKVRFDTEIKIFKMSFIITAVILEYKSDLLDKLDFVKTKSFR